MPIKEEIEINFDHCSIAFLAGFFTALFLVSGLAIFFESIHRSAL